MQPQTTATKRPMPLVISDDIRLQIERGDLGPGDAIPTLKEIVSEWEVSTSVARRAHDLLKEQGLITPGRGAALIVRPPRPQALRSSDRHQAEKDRVQLPEEERAKVGTSETETDTPLRDLAFNCTYEVIQAGEELAGVFEVEPGTDVLARIYETAHPKTGVRHAWSVSYLPTDLISGNPDLLDSANEPWPGGHQHQLSTVGIEVMRVVDEVTAAMPTTADREQWDLEPGVPLLKVRRISHDGDDRVVEVSDAVFPADRTKLSFTTPLRPW